MFIVPAVAANGLTSSKLAPIGKLGNPVGSESASAVIRLRYSVVAVVRLVKPTPLEVVISAPGVASAGVVTDAASTVAVPAETTSSPAIQKSAPTQTEKESTAAETSNTTRDKAEVKSQ